MAAVASLRTFSSPPGRKVMLLLAGAWPLSPAEFAAAGGALPEALEEAYANGVLGYEELYGPLIDTANLLGYTLYPVDVAGIAGRIDPETPIGFAAWSRRPELLRSRRKPPRRHAFLAERRAAAPSSTTSASWRSPVSPPIRAPTTGSDCGSTAPPTTRGTTSASRCCGRSGGRAREGFVDPSRETEMTLMSESALLFGTPASALAAQLKFEPPERAGRGQMKLRLEIGFPLDRSRSRRTAIGVPRTSRCAWWRWTTKAPAPPPGSRPAHRARAGAEPGAVHWHAVELTLERRWHRIVAGIFDPASGKIYSSSAEIAP